MPRKRITGPTALAGKLIAAKEASGLTQELIAERTREIDADGHGVAAGTVYYTVNGAHRDPSIKTLYLIGRVLGVSLRDQITALGYDYDATSSDVPDTRVLRLQRMIGAAAEDDLRRIERMLTLMEDERPRVDGFLDGIEGSRGKEIQAKKR